MPQLLDPRSLEHFLAVYQERHFRRAAERLYMNAGMLSRSIIDLERRMGVNLFERGPGRPVEPTPEGHHLHGQAQRLIDGLQSLPSAAAGDEAGTSIVRVGVLGAGLGGADSAQIINRWQSLFPGVVMVHVPLDSYTHDTALLSGLVDLAVVCITGTEEDEILSHVAYTTQRAVVVRQEDPLADADFVRPEELADRELLYSVIPGRLGELWGDVPVDQGRRDMIITDPAYVSMAVAVTGRVATHSMAAAGLGAVAGTKFVPLGGAEVQIGVQIRTDEQRPAVRALFDLVRLCTVTGPDPASFIV